MKTLILSTLAIASVSHAIAQDSTANGAVSTSLNFDYQIAPQVMWRNRGAQPQQPRRDF